MTRIQELREKARQNIKKIVLPEGDDPRVVKGAAFAAKERIAEVYLLGKKDDILELAKSQGVSLDGVNLIDPSVDPRRGDVINKYFELRKHKGMTVEEAEKTVMGNHVYYGAVMSSLGLADGYVAGASHTTADVARSAIHCFDLLRDIGTVTSCFVMELDNCRYGDKGLFIYADCGIIPYPSPKQLAGITIAASDLFRKLFGIDPKVAMLSYSTKGSAKGETIDAVVEALGKVKEKRPDLMVDGELQVDAALVPGVAALKCPGSKVAGGANVLIFPNLDAGNIAYKLTQRLANARAVGPIILGLEKPCSDLSRGCDWNDVVDATAITAVRVQ